MKKEGIEREKGERDREKRKKKTEREREREKDKGGSNEFHSRSLLPEIGRLIAQTEN